MKKICCFCESTFSDDVRICGFCDEYKGIMTIKEFEEYYGILEF